MKQTDKYRAKPRVHSNALVISPNVDHRLQLKVFLEYLQRFHLVDSAPNLEDARDLLSDGSAFSYVFISQALDPVLIGRFIDAVRRSENGAETVFILVLKSDHNNSEQVAEAMVSGVHGFLCEPYSIERIVEVIGLASEARLMESSVRLRAATGLMLSNMIPDASGNTEDLPEGIWERVQHSCRVYHKLTGHSVTTSVVDELQALPLSKRLPEYSGMAERVKSTLQTQFKNRLRFFARDGSRE